MSRRRKRQRAPGKPSDSVASVGLVDDTRLAVCTDGLQVWFETVQAMGFDPDTAAVPEMPVWEPWDSGERLRALQREIAAKVTGGHDVTGFLFRQGELAALLEGGVDGEDGAGVARVVDSGGGGGFVSGGAADGAQVGGAGVVASDSGPPEGSPPVSDGGCAETPS